MNIAIRYYTRSGNTETLARIIEDTVGAKAESVAVPLHEKADILFLGCSYYAFDVDEAVKNFITQNKDNIGKIVCFGTSAMNRIAEHIKARRSVRTFDGRELNGKDREDLVSFLETVDNPFHIPVSFKLMDAKMHGLT